MKTAALEILTAVMNSSYDNIKMNYGIDPQPTFKTLTEKRKYLDCVFKYFKWAGTKINKKKFYYDFAKTNLSA